MLSTNAFCFLQLKLIALFFICVEKWAELFMCLLLPRTSLCFYALLGNTPLLGAGLQNGAFVGWSQQHCHTRGCSRALPGAVHSGLLLLSLLIMLFWNTSRVWVLDAANPTLVFMFSDKSYVIALQMY